MNWHIYVDGACSGNPGESGAGMAVFNDEGEELLKGSKYLGRMTNNMAEYEALIYALQEASENGIQHVSVYTDSQLVANQVCGEYRVRNEKLRPYLQKVLDLIGQFDSFTLKYIPREANRLADKLAKMAAEKGQAGDRRHKA
jgi:ribonuclease HI